MSGTPYNYDYSKTLWMKMFLAVPDYEKGISDVKITFNEALEIIKTVDNITQGITKIVYLVGWQGLGHDDCFPEMHIVNEALKRDCDKTAADSLWWLYEQAKKYNTVVSFHGNISDEYGDNASHQEFVDADAIVKDGDGKPAVIEVFNGRNAYKISYKQYWESGLFKKYWEKFCETTPVKEAGTVHLDNFCIAESLNPRTDVYEQDKARNSIIDYINSQGIDVTTEYTYRELPWRADSPDHPIRSFYATVNDTLPEASFEDAPIRCLGRIAAAWWMSNMTPQECIEIAPSVYSGHLNTEFGNVFYGAMHGEDIWMDNGIDKNVWVPLFIKEFCTYQLAYFYLNRYRRIGFEEKNGIDGDGRFTAYFSEDVVSDGFYKSITKKGIVLKKGNDVILPLTEDNNTFIAYSAEGKKGDWNIPDAEFENAEIFAITADGNVYVGRAVVSDGKISLDLEAGQAVAIKAAD